MKQKCNISHAKVSQFIKLFHKKTHHHHHPKLHTIIMVMIRLIIMNKTIQVQTIAIIFFIIVTIMRINLERTWDERGQKCVKQMIGDTKSHTTIQFHKYIIVSNLKWPEVDCENIFIERWDIKSIIGSNNKTTPLNRWHCLGLSPKPRHVLT